MLSCAVLQLLYLDVSVNNITGTLPSSWGNLTQASAVTTICTCICMLLYVTQGIAVVYKGPKPICWFCSMFASLCINPCHALHGCFLAVLLLSGADFVFPNSVISVQLQVLALNGNQLMGSLPETWSNLTNVSPNHVNKLSSKCISRRSRPPAFHRFVTCI